jgi:uncharacterized HAD superfamily protein
MSKTYVFDLDGTLCEEKQTFERSLAAPIQQNINICNHLYDKGNHIIIYTARSWAEYKMTENWLLSNNVKYHQLLCGKPIYYRWIDDRALNSKDINSLME